MLYTPRTGRRFLALALSCALGFASTASADTLTLMWDLNDEPEVTGYLVHVGLAPGQYAQTIDVGNTDTYVFAQAQPGQQYCFAVTAYAGALLSPLSEEVCGSSSTEPFLTQPYNQTTAVGQPAMLQLEGGDPGGGAVTFSSAGLPPGMMIDQALGLISGTPSAAGAYAVTVSVSNGSVAVSRSFTWTVTGVPGSNTAPTLAAPGNQAGTSGQAVVLQLYGGDADGDALIYSASGLPAGLSLNAGTGRITGAPSATGVHVVTATVSDGTLTASRAFTWTVSAAPAGNAVPSLAAPDNQTSTRGEAVVLQLQGSDANGDVLTYSAVGLPPGLQIAGTNGRIAGTTLVSGTFTPSVTVSDGVSSTTRSFTWTVADVVAEIQADREADTSRAIARTSTKVSEYTGRAAALRTQAADAPEPTRETREMTGTATLRTTQPAPAGDAPLTYTGTRAAVRALAGVSSGAQSAPESTGALSKASGGDVSSVGALGGSFTRSLAGALSAEGTQVLAGVDSTGAYDYTHTGSMALERSAGSTVSSPAHAPVVSIQTPVDGASVGAAGSVIFSGVAKDGAEDLSDRIVWSSSLDGQIGSGALMHATLTAGTHTITAAVTNGGVTRKAQVTIVVGQ